MAQQNTQNQANTIRVWDPLVRLFHGSLVLSFFVAMASAEDFMQWHLAAGYTIAALVAFRLIWGVIGTRNARFTRFVVAPRKALEYCKQMLQGTAPAHEGHNPAAGWMILALLLGLILSTLSGFAAYGAAEQAGPLAGVMAPIAGWGGEWMEALHEGLVFATLSLVGLHVLGVLFSSWLHNENLIRAMITGTKPLPGHASERPAHPQQLLTRSKGLGHAVRVVGGPILVWLTRWVLTAGVTAFGSEKGAGGGGQRDCYGAGCQGTVQSGYTNDEIREFGKNGNRHD